MPSSTNTIEFACKCGQRVRARFDQGGKTYKCTSCGSDVHIPTVAIVNPAPTADAAPTRREAQPPLGFASTFPKMQVPASFGQLLLFVAGGWLVLSILIIPVMFFSAIAAAILFLLFSLAAGQQIWSMLVARQRVLTAKNVPLLWNFVRLIAWDPVEGILMLKNKSVFFCDDNLDDGAGGVRLLYSILGEELAIRAPLEVQTLAFRDENVLTREYLSVTIRGTMKWRIVNLRKFYLLVSRELRSTTNENDQEAVSRSTRPVVAGDAGAEPAIRQLVRAAISWMQILVEEETRGVVSRARSGLLIADKLSQELFPQQSDGSHNQQAAATGGGGTEWGGAADGLAGAIHDTIARRLEAYGIAVEDVSLQEIKLPDEVMRECIEACKSYYLPTIAKRKAAFTMENLKAQADVIGKEALGTREVVGAAPAFTLPDFLSQYLNKRLGAIGSAPPSSAGEAAVVAALVGQNATQEHLPAHNGSQ